MLRTVTITRKPAVKADLIVDTVVLDYETRQQKTLVLYGEGGTVAEFSSEKEPHLREGDAFKLEDGKLIVVRAANEKLFRITAENPLRLIRLAWQLGGRHVAMEATAEAVFVASNPELEDLIRGQGCAAEAIERPFEPEEAAHGHDCCHHDHGHHHAHDHEHHHHGGGCGCGCGGHGKHQHHDHAHHNHGQTKHDH